MNSCNLWILPTHLINLLGKLHVSNKLSSVERYTESLFSMVVDLGDFVLFLGEGRIDLTVRKVGLGKAVKSGESWKVCGIGMEHFSLSPSSRVSTSYKSFLPLFVHPQSSKGFQRVPISPENSSFLSNWNCFVALDWEWGTGSKSTYANCFRKCFFNPQSTEERRDKECGWINKIFH